MLGIGQYVVGGEMSYHSAMDYVLAELAENRCKGDWSVVGCFMATTFLEEWDDVGFLPL